MDGVDGQDEVEGKTVNVGLAIVTPVEKVLEVMNHPELKQMREEIEKELVKKKCCRNGRI